MFPDADGTPNPATRQVFVDGARSARRPRDRARWRPLLRRRRRRHDPARSGRSTRTRRRPRRSSRRRLQARRRCRVAVRRDRGRPIPTATRSSTRGTSTATAPTTTRPRPTAASTHHEDGRAHGAPAGDRPLGLSDTEQFDGRRSARRRRRDHAPGDDATYAVGDTGGVRGRRTRPDGSHDADRPPRVDGRPPPLLGRS